jgi:hypothetical protein
MGGGLRKTASQALCLVVFLVEGKLAVFLCFWFISWDVCHHQPVCSWGHYACPSSPS